MTLLWSCSRASLEKARKHSSRCFSLHFFDRQISRFQLVSRPSQGLLETASPTMHCTPSMKLADWQKSANNLLPPQSLHCPVWSFQQINLLFIAWALSDLKKPVDFLSLLLILQLLPRMILFSYWLKSKRPKKHCGRGACRKGKSLPLLQKFGNCFSLPAAFKLESGIHVLLFAWKML